MQRTAREATPHTAVRLCGTVRKTAAAAELWRGDAGAVQVRGVVSCGSPWECPHCATRVGRERAAELDALAEAHRAAGGELYHLILTVAHDDGCPLKPLRRHVADAWRYCLSGAPWRRMMDRLGYVGFVRALDTTIGPNGWHPHLHTLIFLDAPASDEQLLELRDWIYARWCKAVAKPVKGAPPEFRQLRPPNEENGVVLREAVLAHYLAEASICWSDEAASHTMKTARRPGHYTPWQLLRGIALETFATVGKTRWAIRRWLEWAADMRGARQLTYSRGLRERYGLRDPLADQDAVSNQLSLELGETPRLRVTVPAWEWNHLVRPNVALNVALLDLVADATVPDAECQAIADDWIEAAHERRRRRAAA